MCLWQADALGSTLQLAAALSAAVCIALAWPRAHRSRPTGSTREPVEAVLLLAALSGTVVVAASRDVGTWLVALELATLPVIALVALSGRRSAVAGATQLLVTSLVSFALLVLGVALWFAATGSPFLTPDAALSSGGAFSTVGGAPARRRRRAVGRAVAVRSGGVVALATVLVLAGVGFKLSLVPFHAWTPTAYAGSSVPVATFLATVSKVAALAALLVVLRAVAASARPPLLSIAVLAALSMTLGNVMALRQDDVVRLLAWSTVAQAGWVVLPLVSISALGRRAPAPPTCSPTSSRRSWPSPSSPSRCATAPGAGAARLAAYEGCWHRSPWRAGALVLALTSLAGLPPGVLGLVGKVVALRPVVAEGWGRSPSSRRPTPSSASPSTSAGCGPSSPAPDRRGGHRPLTARSAGRWRAAGRSLVAGLVLRLRGARHRQRPARPAAGPARPTSRRAVLAPSGLTSGPPVGTPS